MRKVTVSRMRERDAQTVLTFRITYVHLYILRFKEKERRAAVMAKATAHKQGSVQRFKFAGRLQFSVGLWII